MAEVKVYKKRGNTNYKEKKLIKAIREKIAEKQAADPNFKMEPATSFKELENLHHRMVADNVSFEEVDVSASKETISEKTEENMDEDKSPEIETAKEVEPTTDRDFVDPFNREEPIVRDYVLGGDYGEEAENDGGEQQSFAEPMNDKEAFDISDAEEVEDDQADSSSSSEKKTATKKVSATQSEPLNPNFDEMSPKKQKRSTKRFAKHIVNAVTNLMEKGFVWFANKDINEGKLAEYELNGEIDLSLMLQLEGGQEATVKEFFQKQCAQAEELSKISQEDKDDLADALAEVLLEKGVAPTPMQELIMVGVSVLGGQAIMLMGVKQQTNSVLNQLKAMNEGNYVAEDYEAAAHEHEEAAHEHEEAAENYENAAESRKRPPANEEYAEEPLSDKELLLEDKTIETKE